MLEIHDEATLSLQYSGKQNKIRGRSHLVNHTYISLESKGFPPPQPVSLLWEWVTPCYYTELLSIISHTWLHWIFTFTFYTKTVRIYIQDSTLLLGHSQPSAGSRWIALHFTLLLFFFLIMSWWSIIATAVVSGKSCSPSTNQFTPSPRSPF